MTFRKDTLKQIMLCVLHKSNHLHINKVLSNKVNKIFNSSEYVLTTKNTMQQQVKLHWD